MVKIYLDTCALQRPLDTKNQLRIALESEAVLGLLSLWEGGGIELILSDAHIFEAENNTNITRKEFAFEILSQAVSFTRFNESIEKQAREIHKKGIQPLDALHLAFADASSADFFCTCDDDLLKDSKDIENLKPHVISPINLIKELEK